MNASASSPSRSGERGLTVPELLIAVLLFVSMAVVTLGTMHGLVGALDRRSASHGGDVALDQQIAQIRSDARTAFAVFVPAKDVFGQQNDGHLTGVPPHEVDFYTRTDGGTDAWWAYRFDALAHTLQRYDYDPTKQPTVYGVFDRTSGSIDTGAQYPPITGITEFTAATLQANQLGDPAHDAYSGLLSGLSGGAAPRAEPMGFVPSPGPRPDLFGGNASIDVTIATDRGSRSVHLLSGAMASGFTIPKAMDIRVVTYSMITHHRSWFGLASKSRGHVYEQLQYRLLADTTQTWKLWCDWELYGIGTGSPLNAGDRQFNPTTDYHETAGYAFFVVTHDGVKSANPYPDPCNPQYPTLETRLPLPPTPAPISQDTPPPCFFAGTCWPPEAPPDWSPPSPWPSASPPPWWCAGHAQSLLCSGPGPAATPSGGATPPIGYGGPPTPAPPTPTPVPIHTRPPHEGPPGF